MGWYRRILVCVDGSDSSKNALRQACAMAKGENVWVTAITVMPDYRDQFQSLGMRERAARALRREADKVIAEAVGIAQEEGVFIRTILAEASSTIDAIVDAASEGAFDLTMIGKHGKKMIESALMGGVTAGVIGLSSTDVLVVPRGASVGWKRLLVATDGSIMSARAVKRAVEIAGAYGGELIALAVVDVTDEFQALAPDAVDKLVESARGFAEAAGKEAGEAGVKAEARVRQGDAFRVITDMARSDNADLIVLGSHGRTGFRKILMGSVAEKVIGYAPCPVLVVKDTDRQIER